MNHRPSTSILSLTDVPPAAPAARSARSLRRRIVGGVWVATVVVLVVVAYAGLVLLRRAMVDAEDARIASAASLAQQLVDRVVDERARQVEMIAGEPLVIGAAKAGAAEATRLGLPAQFGSTMPSGTLAAIEARFKATRSLQVDAVADRYLTALLPRLEIAEVMVTDRYGYNAVTTSPSSDFVQSDESWWQTAWTSGRTAANATVDPAVGRTVVELAAVIRDADVKVGVVKVKFGLATVDSVLGRGSDARSGLRVDLVDSTGKVIASSTPSTRFKPLAGFAAIAPHGAGTAFTYAGDSATQRAAVMPANAGAWRVVAHLDDDTAMRPYRMARLAFGGGLTVVVLALVALLGGIGRFVEQRIAAPAEELAAVAEAVAAGDLSRDVADMGAEDEIGRLARSIGAMIRELRRLARALNDSAHETAVMTAEITASSEEMAASAGQIAHTASDLSQQASVMAGTIQTLAGASERLVDVAGQLDAGADEGIARNAELRRLAMDNRARLNASAGSLTSLMTDIEANASAVEQLAGASKEVRTFVTLVQKMARQSKLLALNAAMEAARAGEHGQGFAVVAEEVRRLAATSSEAAERTERVVSQVLGRIAESREAADRTVDMVRTVHAATAQGSHSFEEIERALAEADAWTSSVRLTVTAADGLAREMRLELDSLAAGTESFAAAMQEVAASSEEQSASTEQIAAAAGTLAGAAERLARLASNLKQGEDATSDERPPMPPMPPMAPVRAPNDVAVGRGTPLSTRAVPARG